jgi:DNA-binding NarL/FixJ family response regulator
MRWRSQERREPVDYWGLSSRPHEERSVVIADDDERFLAMVANVYERAGYTVRPFTTGEEALESVRGERPSLVVVDVRLEGMSGYDVCRVLRATFGDSLPIVFVSGERTESFDRVGGLRLGADDYLVKPVDPDELLARSDRLVSRTRSAHPMPASAARNLTRRETDVLELLVSGLRSKEIAQELSISGKTVAVHVQNILAKFGVHSQAQAVAAALSNGFITPASGGAPHRSMAVAKPPQNGAAVNPRQPRAVRSNANG